MSKDYQDLQSLDPQEDGNYRSGHNSNVKETQKKQEENLSNYSLSVESHFQAVRSGVGNMQEKVNSLETTIKKLEFDKTEEMVQQAVQELKNIMESLKCDFQKMSTNDSSMWCCPENWVGFSGSCYLLSRIERSWKDSKKFCESKNAYLVVINTVAEQIFVQEKAAPLYTWIGLTDSDGKWSWVDGTNYDNTPKNWLPAQPDEFYGHGLGGGEDCVHLYPQGKWNDGHCSREYGAVCEKKSG